MRTIKLVVYRPDLIDGLRRLFERLSGGSESQARVAKPARGTEAKYDYFVSYAREDSTEVDALVSGFRAVDRALRIFVDRLEIEVGASWQADIDRALASCRRVIPLYSPAFLDSAVCLEEFNMARLRHRKSGRVLAPIWLRDVELPLYMESLNYIDCREARVDLLRGAAERLVAAG